MAKDEEKKKRNSRGRVLNGPSTLILIMMINEVFTFIASC